MKENISVLLPSCINYDWIGAWPARYKKHHMDAED